MESRGTLPPDALAELWAKIAEKFPAGTLAHERAGTWAVEAAQRGHWDVPPSAIRALETADTHTGQRSPYYALALARGLSSARRHADCAVAAERARTLLDHGGGDRSPSASATAISAADAVAATCHAAAGSFAPAARRYQSFARAVREQRIGSLVEKDSSGETGGPDRGGATARVLLAGARLFEAAGRPSNCTQLLQTVLLHATGAHSDAVVRDGVFRNSSDLFLLWRALGTCAANDEDVDVSIRALRTAARIAGVRGDDVTGAGGALCELAWSLRLAGHATEADKIVRDRILPSIRGGAPPRCVAPAGAQFFPLPLDVAAMVLSQHAEDALSGDVPLSERAASSIRPAGPSRNRDRGGVHPLARVTASRISPGPLRHPERLAARERAVRVAIVSGDFRDHPVGDGLRAFLGAWRAWRPQRSKPWMTFVCVDLSPSVALPPSRYFSRDLCDEWVHVAARPDQSLERLRIDVLIDTGGWTSTGRLAVTTRARGEVAVTLSWLGFPGSTASRAVDAVVTDRVSSPAHLASRVHSEKLIVLPEGLTWIPSGVDTHRRRAAVDSGGSRPARNAELCGFPRAAAAGTGRRESRRPFVFGFVGQVVKLDSVTLSAFAAILRRAPHAALLFLIPNHSRTIFSANVAAVTREMGARGVARDRMVFLPRVAKGRHIEVLRSCVDLALEATAHSGGSTALDLVHAGVPFIAVPSSRMATRIGASVLHASGLADAHPFVVANNITAQVSTAVHLSQPRGRAVLDQMRAHLESRVRDGTAFNTTHFAAAFAARLHAAVEVRHARGIMDMHLL